MHKALLLLSCGLFAGCTNVTSDRVQYLHPNQAEGYHSARVFELAREHLAGNGYHCELDGAHFASCAKITRDSSLHSTRVIIRLEREHDEGNSVLLLASRWDEGLIPSEFISNRFESEDLARLCQHLASRHIATCKETPS